MLVVWRLDRLGRSMTHLVTLIEGLLQRQVGFRSLGDGAIDTTTASGELVFHIFPSAMHIKYCAYHCLTCNFALRQYNIEDLFDYLKFDLASK